MHVELLIPSEAGTFHCLLFWFIGALYLSLRIENIALYRSCFHFLLVALLLQVRPVLVMLILIMSGFLFFLVEYFFEFEPQLLMRLLLLIFYLLLPISFLQSPIALDLVNEPLESLHALIPKLPLGCLIESYFYFHGCSNIEITLCLIRLNINPYSHQWPPCWLCPWAACTP